MEIQEVHGLRTIFNVHDSIVVACDQCSCDCADDSQAPLHQPGCPWVAARAAVEEVMCRVPRMLPGLADLPLACKVSTLTRVRYVE